MVDPVYAAQSVASPLSIEDLFRIACVILSWPVMLFGYAIYRLIKERVELRRYYNG